MRTRSTWILAPAAVVLAALILGGCHSATVPQSVLPALAANDEETQLDFWHTLAAKPLICNDEAFHGLLLFLNGADNSASYGERIANLKSAKLLPKTFNQPADAALTRGTLAIALVNALELKESISLLLLGPNPHHATRELEYHGIYPPSSPNQIFSGAAFVGVIGKVRDFTHGNPADYPAWVMPSSIPHPHPIGAEPAAPTAAADDELITPIFAAIDGSALTLSPATTTASTAPAADRAVITEVEGIASYRDNESAPWKKAARGVALGEQAELRTGPNGAIQLRIEPDQTIAIDRLTTVRLLRIFREGSKAATDIGIKYGRTRYDLEGGGLEHQSTLRSPNATLAVRGTRVSLFDQPPFTPQAVSLTGRAQFQGLHRQAVAFGAAGQGKTVIDVDSDSPAELALQQSIIDPTLQGARSQSEAALVENLVSRGATVTIERTSGLRIIHGGTVPRTDAELTPLLPGQLNFVLRWTGDTNLDLAVSTPDTPATPGGEFIYPVAGLTSSKSGGRTAFDHQGGPNGGIEVVFFDKVPTTGVFSIGGPNVGTTTAVATIDAFLNGQHVDLFDGLNITPTVIQTVAPGQPALALASIGAPFPFASAPQARRPARKKPAAFVPPPPNALVAGPVRLHR